MEYQRWNFQQQTVSADGRVLTQRNLSVNDSHLTIGDLQIFFDDFLRGCGYVVDYDLGEKDDATE